jgi:hypothetical protein
MVQWGRRIRDFLPLVLALSRVQAQGQRAPAQVEFTTACSCVLCHGKYRWGVKTDPAQAPASIAADHRLTPSALRRWSGPGGKVGKNAVRSGRELEWWELTGEIRAVRIEDDGDIHLQLVDPGSPTVKKMASVEIPDGAPWCAMREQIFSLTNIVFPVRFSSHQDLQVRPGAVVTVVGRAFYDADNDGGDSRANDRDGAGHTRTTVWEIHPVMKLAFGNK